MRLHELKPPPGSNIPAKRVGRGIGSGQGKTAGRGQKGQKSRSGGGVRRGFEGGQMPLFQRLPKRGFSNKRFRTEWSLVNIEELNRFTAGTLVTPELLQTSGLIQHLNNGIKVLGKGELAKELIVQAHRFSARAKQKIESAGGRAEVI